MNRIKLTDGHLYRIEFPNGKSYIGIAQNVASRFRSHCSPHSQTLVSRALRKYGVDSVRLTTLTTVGCWDALCDLERQAIAFFETRPPNGYNLTDGGDGAVGVKISERTRERMRKGPEARAYFSATTKKYFEDPVARTRQSAALKRAYENPEARARASAGAKTRWANPVERARFSIKAKTRFANPMYRAQFRAAMNRPEVRANKSAAIKKAMHNAEIRTRHLAALNSPEYRARRSEVAKKMWAKPNSKIRAALNRPDVLVRRGAAIKAAWARRRESQARRILQRT